MSRVRAWRASSGRQPDHRDDAVKAGLAGHGEEVRLNRAEVEVPPQVVRPAEQDDRLWAAGDDIRLEPAQETRRGVAADAAVDELGPQLRGRQHVPGLAGPDIGRRGQAVAEADDAHPVPGAHGFTQ